MKKILIIILILILPIVALAAELFSDGFESGDLTAWDFAVTNGGDLSAETAAKLHGAYGLNCLINDTNPMYVYDETPSGETRYRVRFYVDPNSLSMADYNAIYLCFTKNAADGEAFIIKLMYRWLEEAWNYVITVSDASDGGWDFSTDSYVITNAPHCIEVDWKASTGAGNDDGEIRLWIDGVLKETLSNIDNDTEQVDKALFGAIDKSAGITGTLFLDDFASNDDGSEIGVISEAEDNAIFFGMNF